jgi:hypothetical protein
MLSPAWRHRLERWWGASIETIYGFSELAVCNARLCPACDHYHLPPSGLAEVVDPGDAARGALSSGRGALVVTAFYPFVQLEPRIRYRPGDIAELADAPCPAWHETGFRILGRERNAVRFERPPFWITAADCFDAIADLPAVATRHAHVMTSADPRYHEAGSPLFNLQTVGGQASLHVELRYDPDIWPEEAAEVRRFIQARIPAGVSVALHGPRQLPGEPCFA